MRKFMGIDAEGIGRAIEELNLSQLLETMNTILKMPGTESASWSNLRQGSS